MRMPARSVLALACCTAACGSSDPAGDGSVTPDTAGGIVEEADQCTASVAAGAGDAWTTMPLVNDTSNPDKVVTHVGADFVTGIYYATPDQGFITSQDDGLMNPRGGAV